jgi:hypothetical protein
LAASSTFLTAASAAPPAPAPEAALSAFSAALSPASEIFLLAASFSYLSAILSISFLASSAAFSTFLAVSASLALCSVEFLSSSTILSTLSMALSLPLPPEQHPHWFYPQQPHPALSTVSATNYLTLPASVLVIMRAAITNEAILFIIELLFLLLKN